MRKVLFITGNEDKFFEAKRMLDGVVDLHQLDIDLPEIQSLDSRVVIKHKLISAHEHHSEAFIVDDTSLVIDSLGDLPGPLIKWFIASLGLGGVAELVSRYENRNASAFVMVGYSDSENNISYFEGGIVGKIVPPRGENGFGWDKIFELGNSKTRGELVGIESDQFSPRRIALEKLRDHLKVN